jgi:phenylalanyl-tRNA synthetase alpha chain
MEDLEALERDLLAAVVEAENEDALEAVRVRALGKKGEVTTRLKGLAEIAPGTRKATAERLNHLKGRIGEEIAARAAALAEIALAARLEAEKIDVSLPPRPEVEGRIHPVSHVIEEIIEIFAIMGFVVAQGPDIEDDFHNFTALNIPPEHPARQMHDTFYLPEQADGRRPLLRTHTSPVQIRSMQAASPPYRLIAPGRTFRCDSDQTHTPMFHQVEGLVIARDIHMGHLKGVLRDFASAFFEVDGLKMRFRPSYFPFTEPSAEVDIGCRRQGDELRIGEGDDWLEIAGCGMVHPKVLRHVGLNPDEWQGFAFGMGIDRVAMLKYGIPDLRDMFEPDLQWLQKFGFRPYDTPSLGRGLGR